MLMNEYTTKKQALKVLKKGQLLCNRNITRYIIAQDYQHLLKFIYKSRGKTDDKDYSICNYYEFIPEKSLLNLYLDIEIYKDNNVDYYNDDVNMINNIRNRIKDYFHEYSCTFYIVESHIVNVKKSYHVITRVQSNKQDVYFNDTSVVKKIIVELFPELTRKKIVDTSVYREGLFRTIYSSKNNENRPFTKSILSDKIDEQDDILYFVAYCPGSASCRIIKNEKKSDKVDGGYVKIEEDGGVGGKSCGGSVELSSVEKSIVNKFCLLHFKQVTRDIILDTVNNYIVISLQDKYCYNINREHKSNHQYIVVDSISAKQKCHDEECKNYKHNEIMCVKYPVELNLLLVSKLQKTRTEQDLVQETSRECAQYITENFDSNPYNILFDKNEMVFRSNASDFTSINLKGNCTNCQVEHEISNTGYCIKCIVCKSIFPKSSRIPIDDKFKSLNNFWVNYTQLINTGTINNNVILNIYNNLEDDFSCDIKLDESIFRGKELTNLYNQILDGHKVVKLSELLKRIEGDFIYSNGEWYYFNGFIWVCDDEALELRKRIVKLSNYFNKIKLYYETKPNVEVNTNIIKNIKTLINKLHKTSFEDDVIKGAKMYYNDKKFTWYLNSKKHLIPFENGVYDLLEGRFKKTKKDDYINLTVKYNYVANVYNKEVEIFIENILPDKGIRDYVLKKLSECLNSDIPNTNFLMFIGNGANGKSQLLNLMKLAMGELGEKVEVTLLTRKRTNANEANTEKMKLINKRFAYLSEPEDGEKINVSLLKELTGSEEIVARGLYKNSISFIMESKLFLACNELPEIKGEDTALWRRIKVIKFSSSFVDDPQKENEFKIDRTLPSRMREDITWRQTLMNILIKYYFLDIKEPPEITSSTREYRNNNDVTTFVLMYAELNLQQTGKGLRWSEVWEYFQEWYVQETGSNLKQKKTTIKKYFEDHVFQSKEMPIRNIGRGWTNWSRI